MQAEESTPKITLKIDSVYKWVCKYASCTTLRTQPGFSDYAYVRHLGMQAAGYTCYEACILRGLTVPTMPFACIDIPFVFCKQNQFIFNSTAEQI